LEAELWDEFPSWLRREFMTAASGAISPELSPFAGTDSQGRVLQAFVMERAIGGLPEFGPLGGIHHIWFFRHAAARQRAVHIEPFQAGDPTVSSVSLGPDAHNQGQLVKDLGPEKVRQCVDELARIGLIQRIPSTSPTPLYVLCPDHVRIAVDPNGEGDSGADITGNWLRADMHSSELGADRRRDIEERFRSGDLDFVAATPTLEMGIDIGDIDQAVMIGAPPLPSNYAQRAGRAGRKRNQRAALIACLCSSKSEHDSMAFEDPVSMIAGRITPPEFDPKSLVLATRHLHAWLADRSAPVDPITTATAWTLFGDALEVNRYLATEYANERERALRRRPSDQNERKWFYECGFFPDYGFNRDQVQVRDDSLRPDKRSGGNAPKWEYGEYRCVAERDKDRAYLKFCPKRILPAAGGYWLLKVPKEPDSYSLLGGPPIPTAAG
jgi:hypothetical protein